MNTSPVFLRFLEKIQLEKSSEISIYIQISEQISKAIQQEIVSNESKLPGTRTLSRILKIHRNTAVAVYEELASQGVISIVPNKGSFVSFSSEKIKKISATTTKNNSKKTPGFSFSNALHLKNPNEATVANSSCTDGQPDFNLVSQSDFNKQLKRALQAKTLAKKWNWHSENENWYFEKQLCNYLKISKNITATPQSCTSTRTVAMSLYIAAQLLLKANQIVVVGTLSNPNTNMLFQQIGATIKTISQDKEGLEIDKLEDVIAQGKIRAIYLNTACDYPTTVALCEARRSQLYQLAKKHEFVIIEHDDASDYFYTEKPFIPMTSKDTEQLIIYIGSIGAGFLPNFQAGVVVGPENFIAEVKNYSLLLDTYSDAIQKQVLASSMFEGELFRVQNKTNWIYKQRLDAICEALKLNFKTTIHFEKPKWGLAIWIEFKKRISLVQFANELDKEGFYFPKTLLFQTETICAIRLGFGNFSEMEANKLVKKMAEIYFRLVNSH